MGSEVLIFLPMLLVRDPTLTRKAIETNSDSSGDLDWVVLLRKRLPVLEILNPHNAGL